MSFDNFLFVYGSLMSQETGALGRTERTRLQREGKSLGPATIAGRLYDLGECPGLVDARSAADLVHGEVFALATPAATLAWLDAYEDVAPGAAKPGEYERIQRAVRLARGTDVSVWAYLYRGDLSAARQIPGGRWRGVKTRVSAKK